VSLAVRHYHRGMALNVADQLVENLREMLSAATAGLGLPDDTVVRAAAEDAARTLPCAVVGHEGRERQEGMETTWVVRGWIDWHTLVPEETADTHRDQAGAIEDWLLGLTSGGPRWMERLFVHAVLAEPGATAVEDRVQSTRTEFQAVVTQAA
jgi:hypothetical protein